MKLLGFDAVKMPAATKNFRAIKGEVQDQRGKFPSFSMQLSSPRLYAGIRRLPRRQIGVADVADIRD